MKWQLQIPHTDVCNATAAVSHSDDEEQCHAAVLLPSPSLAFTAFSSFRGGLTTSLITALHSSSLHELRKLLAILFTSRMRSKQLRRTVQNAIPLALLLITTYRLPWIEVKDSRGRSRHFYKPCSF